MSPPPSLVQQTAHVCSGEFPLAAEPQTSVTWFSYCFVTSVLFHGLLAMTQGTGLLGFHALCKGNSWSQSPFVLGESDFVRDNLIKATIHPQDVATKLLVTPRHRSYHKHLPVYSPFHRWSKFSRFWHLSGVGFSKANQPQETSFVPLEMRKTT